MECTLHRVPGCTRFSRSITVDVPQDIMFAVAAKVEEYKSFLPFCVVSIFLNL